MVIHKVTGEVQESYTMFDAQEWKNLEEVSALHDYIDDNASEAVLVLQKENGTKVTVKQSIKDYFEGKAFYIK